MEQSYVEVETMTQVPGPNDSTEIRRALDRLQSTIESLSDRYRELRRERKQMRARIEELEGEREQEDLTTAARLEAAAIDRRRVLELDERVVQAERRQVELYERVLELEETLSERERLIVEQEETMSRLRSALEEERKREEEGATRSERASEELLELRRQVADLTGRVAALQSERKRLEEQEHQLVGKLDAATRDSGLARMRVEELEEKLATAAAERDAAREQVQSLLAQLKQLESTDDDRLKAQRLRIDALSRDLSDALDMAAKKETEAMEAADALDRLQERVTELERDLGSLREERDSLKGEFDRHGGESAPEKGSTWLSQSDRGQLVMQIDDAIRLIDRHLEGG
jgi:chromosome segregation protein